MFVVNPAVGRQVNALGQTLCESARDDQPAALQPTRDASDGLACMTFLSFSMARRACHGRGAGTATDPASADDLDRRLSSVFCHATGSTGLLERLKLAQALLNEQLRAALELAMRAHPLTSRFDMRHPGAGFSSKDDACEKRRKWRFRQ